MHIFFAYVRLNKVHGTSNCELNVGAESIHTKRRQRAMKDFIVNVDLSIFLSFQCFFKMKTTKQVMISILYFLQDYFRYYFKICFSREFFSRATICNESVYYLLLPLYVFFCYVHKRTMV
jgi:hypothetical protein